MIPLLTQWIVPACRARPRLFIRARDDERFEIADIAAMHKRKLRRMANPWQSVTFAQQRVGPTLAFAKPPQGR
ncbi:hypothetical protein [Sphingopyxis alaskensis]|uniref:hypothetical protein n=1 Tax=Sphingopyxis alaskensis TaxID=117207 RepID=UPI00391BC52C